MKTLYIECNMGAAGDMLMAALSNLIPDPDAFIARMNGLGLPGIRLERKKTEKCGIMGSHISVTIDGEEELIEDVPLTGHHHAHDHEHHHAHDHELHEHDHHHEEHHHHHATVGDIAAIIDGLALPEEVRRHAKAVYDLIAKAESEAHGAPMEQIHFHEVGTLDAVADVVGGCLLMDMIKPDRVVVSPIHVGSGQVRCAHGVLPVPTPATARLLEGVPTYGGKIKGELCTPTGAALLRHFADEFGDMPVMAVEKIGIGMGTKDFEWANCLRAMLGESAGNSEDVAELRCNLDDMTGEAIAFAAEALLGAGALDAWSQPIYMKKGRPGTMLCCLCRAGEEQKFAELMLRNTTTLGVRWQTLRRMKLEREAGTVDSPWGPVRVKRSFGCGVDRVKPEFDDVAAIARREGIDVATVIGSLKKE